MSINQTQFLGASVQSFNTSLGFGSETSLLSVNLIEDISPSSSQYHTAPDAFTYPLAGTPVQFNFNGWNFGGLIQNYKYSRGQDGFKYTVNVVDPREVLNGVALVIGSYNGSVQNTPNLINVYNYYENTSFGSSQWNDSGMPWKKVRDAVNSIVNGGTVTQFGGPITLAGYAYRILLTSLPNIPDDYRIGGDHINLLDFIDEVCQAGACDYFFTLQTGNFITLNTIPRTNTPTIGLISNWINSMNGVVSSETGLEFRNEVVGKFVVGGPKRDMYFQDYQPGNSSIYSDDTIWPDWGYIQPGFAGAGNLILGSDINNEHIFTVDARHVNINFPGVCVDTYTMCVGELRAAVESQNAWESYLWFRNGEPLSPIGVSGCKPSSPLYTNRASKLKMIGNINADLPKLLKSIDNSVVLSQQGNVTKKQSIESSLSWQTQHEEEIKRLYELVHDYATQYYGKRFHVRIPTIQSVFDVDTKKTRFNYEPVSHGFLDESVWDDAVYNNYLPPDINPLLNEDGLIQCYARYDNASLRDFSEISPTDIIFNSGGTSAFVKCGVEEGVGFLDYLNRVSPRAIVTVPGAVRVKPFTIGSGTAFGGILNDYFSAIKEEFGTIDDADINLIKRQFGADQLCLSNKGFVVQPDMIAVPLVSNVSRYGPWKAIGANGKCEFEVDETLVPWNYNGFAGMNLVGQGKVQQAYSNMLQAETGSVEVPGAPTVNLGSAVVAGGPYVTDIQVSIDPQGGVTTRYNLSTWSPRFGAAGKLREARIQKLAKFAQQQKTFNRTVLRKAQQQRPKLDAGGNIVVEPKTERKTAKSTHFMVVGENIPKISGYQSNVGFQPTYLTTSQLHPDEYANKAAASLDTLFRPFTTITNSGLSHRLSHYQTPVSGADSPTVRDLNPYQSGFDFGTLTRGYEFPESLNISEGGYDPSGNYRAMGHRFPMIGVGWGYDVDGKPVPNIYDPVLAPSSYALSGLGDAFYPGYLQHSEYWKAAPVDIRYDYSRGVWVAGGGGGTKIIQIIDSGNFPTHPGTNSYYAREYTATFENRVGESIYGSGVVLTPTSNYFYVGNFRSNIVVANQFYEANKIGGKYYIDNQAVFL